MAELDQQLLSQFSQHLSDTRLLMGEMLNHVEDLSKDMAKRKARNKKLLGLLCGVLIISAFWFYSNSVYETGRKNGATSMYQKFAQGLKDNPSLCVSDGDEIQCRPIPQSSGANSDMRAAGYRGQQ